MIDSFSTGLVERYGLRDGLVLSGICAVSAGGGDAGTSELRKRYGYLSVKQIRKALESLTGSGAVECRRLEGAFTRELRYRASTASVKLYLSDINAVQMPFVRSSVGKTVNPAGCKKRRV